MRQMRRDYQEGEQQESGFLVTLLSLVFVAMIFSVAAFFLGLFIVLTQLSVEMWTGFLS
jgi:hypothetical protein